MISLLDFHQDYVILKPLSKYTTNITDFMWNIVAAWANAMTCNYFPHYRTYVDLWVNVYQMIAMFVMYTCLVFVLSANIARTVHSLK